MPAEPKSTAPPPDHNVQSPAHARAVAEAARESSWRGRGLLRQLFLGRFEFEWMFPHPDVSTERIEFVEFCRELQAFLARAVDSVHIDETGKIPPAVIDGLRRLGAFGMKIEKRYGGLGFSHQEYCRALELIAHYDSNLIALLSAHQSIGAPQPLKLFGTDAQKQTFLPRCAAGEISAFALTEPDVGSDPARIATTVRRGENGSYILDGEKLWITNGTIAKLLVVLARDVETQRISCFLVEAHWPGVEVVQRCHFMGLKAIENGVLRFTNVEVPADRRIGNEGDGLKIALTTLNTGRLSLPATAVAVAKWSTRVCREWSQQRVQWGVPIGEHEAIAHKLSDMAANTFAMESLSYFCNALADHEGYDIRMEAAAAKEWNSTRGWAIVDDTMQIRGGRGYETARSLQSRGEPAIAVERMMRDFRINLIFEGTSEIMHLFLAREAVDQHLEVAGALVDPKQSWQAKLAALPKIIGHYAWWYPSRWFGWGLWPRYSDHGEVAPHLRFVDRNSRRLARAIFHGMLVHQAKLERKQAFLFRAVDIGLELFAMAVVCARVATARKRNMPARELATQITLAQTFCRGAERRIHAWFDALWSNDDEQNYRVAKALLADELTSVEAFPVSGIQPPPVAATPPNPVARPVARTLTPPSLTPPHRLRAG